MHWKPIEETQNGVVYSEMLDEYCVDEKDLRNAVEISAVIQRHMSEMCTLEEADCELQILENSQMDQKGEFIFIYVGIKLLIRIT